MIFFKKLFKKNIIILIITILCIACLLFFTPLHQNTNTYNNAIVELFKGSKAIPSQSDKDKARRLDLQERLQETLISLDEIDDAMVTINPGGKDVAPTAFVVIKLSKGKALTSEREAAIKKLFNSLESNISEENIFLSTT